MLHKTLERQIGKSLGDSRKDISPEVVRLLQIVSDTYMHFDEDRALIERSLDISSKELTGINEKLKANNEELRAKTIELEHFNRLMINRELQMIELKKQVKELKNELIVLKHDMAFCAENRVSQKVPIS